MVHSVQEFRLTEEDRFLQRLAYQAAGIMLASGNMKKSAQVDSIAESIYSPVIVQEENAVKGRNITDDPEKARDVVRKISEKFNKQ